MKKLLITASTIIFLFAAHAESKFLIELSGGKSQMNITNNVQNAQLLNQALETNGDIFDIAVGADYDCYFLTLNYQKFKLPLADIQNIYMSVNLNSGTEPKLFMGLVFGKSFLEWSDAPIANAVAEDTSSSDYFLGVQAGAIYEATDYVSIFAKIQSLNYNHKTVIDNGTLEYKKQTNLNIGVRYEF